MVVIWHRVAFTSERGLIMIKKVAIVAVAVGAVLSLLSFTKFGSYASTSWHKVRVSAARQVPIEFEIDRLKHEVGQLIPDLKKNLSAVAEEMAAVENLEKDVAASRTKLDEQKTVLLKLAKDLDGGQKEFVYCGRAIDREKAATILAKGWDAYKRSENTLKSRTQELELKRRSLDSAKEQLAAMKEQKQELEVQIAQLETEVKTVRLAQTRSKFQFDDSRLAGIKQSLRELQTRLDVEVKTNDLEREYIASEVVPVGEKKVQPVTELTREVREALEGSKVVEK